MTSCGGGVSCLPRGSKICLVGDSLMRQTCIEMACDAQSWGAAAWHEFQLRNKTVNGSTARKIYIEPQSSHLPSVTMVYIAQPTVPSPLNGSFAYGVQGGTARRMNQLLRASCSAVLLGWGAWHVAHYPLTPAAYRTALHKAILGLRRALGPNVCLLLRPTIAQATTTNLSFGSRSLLLEQLRAQHDTFAARCERAESLLAGSNASLSGVEKFLERLAWGSPSQRILRAFNDALDAEAHDLGVEVVGGAAGTLYNLTASRPCLHAHQSSSRRRMARGTRGGMPFDPTHWCTWEATPNPALQAISTLLRRMMPTCSSERRR